MELELNEVALEKILMDENLRDKPVAVISINGKYREGKSFLLNLLLHYLERKVISTNNRIEYTKKFAIISTSKLNSH